MKSVLFKFAAVAALAAAGAIMVVRFVEVKLGGEQGQDGKTYITVSSLFGGTEWPPPKKVQTIRQVAEGRVFDAFVADPAHARIGFRHSKNLRLQGRAGESAVLMAQAGRTAGEVLYVNFRSLDTFVRQKFLVPLDGYILQLARDETARRLRERSTRLRDGTEVTEATARLLAPANPDAVRSVQDERFNPAWVDLHPAVWETVYRPDPSDPNVWHVWAYPFDQETMALNYRKDLFKARADELRALGLDPNRGPETWEELLDYCYALTDPAAGVYGMYFPTTNAWQMTDLIWQGGGEIVVRDEQDQWYPVWDSPQTAQAVRFLRKLLTKTRTVTLPDGTQRTLNICQVNPNTGSTDFSEGRCAMMMFYSSDMTLTFATLDPSVLGLAPLPAGPVQMAATAEQVADEPGVELSTRGLTRWVRFANGAAAPEAAVVRVRGRDGAWGWRIRGNEFNASMWAINAVGTDQAHRDAAWALIRFYGSKAAQRITTQTYVEAGWAAYVNPNRLREFGYAEYLQDMDPQWVRTNLESYRSARPEPNGKNCQQIYYFVLPTFERFAVVDSKAAELAHNEAGRPRFNLDAAGPDDLADILDSLHRDVEITNRLLMGHYTPERRERDTRRAYYVVAAIALVMLFGAWRLVRSLRQMIAPGGRGGGAITAGEKATIRVHAAAWAFLALAVVTVLTWAYYPLIRGAVIAFQDYSVVEGGRWVGMKNFVEVFNSELFVTALLNTFLYVALGLGLGFFTPIFLAILLDEIPRGRLFFRTVYYLPAVMSGLVVAYLWKWMYDPSAAGALNQLLISLHLVDPADPIRWLSSERLAMLSVVIPLVWAGAGPGCIIYLAALKSIPEEIYEAADIDGAGAWKKIRHITIPYLWPLILINFVGAFIGTFKSWQNIFVMTGGGPNNATHVIGMEVWYNAFAYLKFGYATAVAWIVGSMLIGFTLYQLRILRHMRFTTAKRT